MHDTKGRFFHSRYRSLVVFVRKALRVASVDNSVTSSQKLNFFTALFLDLSIILLGAIKGV